MLSEDNDNTDGDLSPQKKEDNSTDNTNLVQKTVQKTVTKLSQYKTLLLKKKLKEESKERQIPLKDRPYPGVFIYFVTIHISSIYLLISTIHYLLLYFSIWVYLLCQFTTFLLSIDLLFI